MWNARKDLVRLSAGEPAGVFSNIGREITVANNGVAGSLEE